MTYERRTEDNVDERTRMGKVAGQLMDHHLPQSNYNVPYLHPVYGIMSREYDHLLKLLIIGDTGVGKSSLLVRFSDDRFQDTYISTIGIDFKIRTVAVGGQRVRVQIWDTAGQERFRTITSTCYRGTNGVVIVYDVTDGNSFANVKRWLIELENNCEDVEKVLVGNKDDCPEQKVVESDDAQRFANRMRLPLFETSAKTNKNVEEMFMTIIRKALQRKLNAARLLTSETSPSKLGKLLLRPVGKSKKKFC